MASTVTSTAGLGLSGLSSGLDTSGIITKLMSIESAPQTALKARLTAATNYRTALQTLNTSVAAIATSSQNAAKTGALTSFKVSSDDAGVTATASSGASAGSVTFSVDSLAKAQVSVSDRMSTWPDTSSSTPTITIQVGTGSTATSKQVTALSTNLDDVVFAINDAGVGVTASKVAAGQDSSGAPLYRLQLRGTTGSGNAFSVQQGAADSATPLPTTTVTTASDASITLYKGVSGAEQTVTSSSNTFKQVLTGIDVTVSKITDPDQPATITVAADSTAATTAAQAMTSGLIALFSGIAAASAVTTGTNSSGATATTGSIFTGDSTVRLLNDSLLSAASGAVDGRSPSSIGIVLTKTGTITFDQSAFAAAMTSDPVGTTTMLQKIADRVGTAASAASNQYDGSLTAKITSQQGVEATMTKDVSDWDTRLAAIQAQYTKQFNALETALNSLSSQSSYLTSQINGLTTNYQNK